MRKSDNVSKFKWYVRKANAARKLVEADGLDYWDGWAWTNPAPNEGPAVKVRPFGEYLAKFEL